MSNSILENLTKAHWIEDVIDVDEDGMGIVTLVCGRKALVDYDNFPPDDWFGLEGCAYCDRRMIAHWEQEMEWGVEFPNWVLKALAEMKKRESQRRKEKRTAVA